MKYDHSDLTRLLARFESLRTFEEVAVWDGLAEAEMDRITAFIDGVEQELRSLAARRDELQRAHEAKGFFVRLFASRAPIAQLDERSSNLRAELLRCSATADDLQERIDMTPDNSREQKALLKELRAQKKELGVQRREVTSGMQEIRAEARDAIANATPGLFRSRQQSAEMRRRIRQQKEQLLGPQEDAKASIDRQLRALERRIIWVERFGSDLHAVELS